MSRRSWLAVGAVVAVAAGGLAWALLTGASGRPARLTVTDTGGLPGAWRGVTSRSDGQAVVAARADGTRVASLAAGLRGVTVTVDLGAAGPLLPGGVPDDLGWLAEVAGRLEGADPRLRRVLERRFDVQAAALADKLRRAAGGTVLALTLNPADLRTAAARAGLEAYLCAALEVVGRPVGACPEPGPGGAVSVGGTTVVLAPADVGRVAPLEAPVTFVAGEAAVLLSGARPASLLPRRGARPGLSSDKR